MEDLCEFLQLDTGSGPINEKLLEKSIVDDLQLDLGDSILPEKNAITHQEIIEILSISFDTVEEVAFEEADNSDLFCHRLQQISDAFKAAGFDFSPSELLSALSHAFPVSRNNPEGPYATLKRMLKISSLAAQRVMLKLDLSAIKYRLLRKIITLDYAKLWFYVGLSTREDVTDRVREHFKNKKVLAGCAMAEYNNLGDALMAESTGITLLKWLREGRLSKRIRGCWNWSDGFDSPELYKSSSKKIILYMLWSPNPKDKMDHSIGATKTALFNQRRILKGPTLYSLNTATNGSDRRDHIRRRHDILVRANEQCNICQTWLTSKLDLEIHMLEHKLAAFQFKCKICHSSMKYGALEPHMATH